MRKNDPKLVYGKYSMKEYAEALIKDLMKHPVNVDEGKGGFDYDDFLLQIDGYIEVYEIENMVLGKSLTGEVRGTGYEIGRVRVYNNYPFAPDDCEYEGEVEESSRSRAVEAAVRMLLEDEMHRSIQAISEQAYSEELEGEMEVDE